jgi:hypothetical protein
MAKKCPECHTVNDDRLGRCLACGCSLSREKPQRHWEAVIAPYLVIAVLLGLIAAAVVYFLHPRSS